MKNLNRLGDFIFFLIIAAFLALGITILCVTDSSERTQPLEIRDTF